ncbi:hypothetical protein WEI85_00460 [Actinomycetes bacterium KLBMP 9797]
MSANRADDYPCIRAYGRMVGSYTDYIDGQVELARAEGAPTNAIHRDRDGGWKTTDDIVSAETRQRLGLDPLPPIPVTVAAMIEEIADKLRSSTWLRDRYGLATTGVDDGTMRLRFTTGHTALIRVDVIKPGTAD